MGKSFKNFMGKTALLGAVFVLVFIRASFASAQGAPLLSHNWSGYVSNQGNFTSVNGSWVVPSVEPADNFSGDMTWVGIGGHTSSDLIQAGTLALISNGKVTYKAWYETLPLPAQITDLTVNANDSISVKITLQPNNLWLIEITNNTTGRTFRTTVFYNSTFSSAEWIEEMPVVNSNTHFALDNFGSVNFYFAGAVSNGNFENLAQSGATAINMIGLKAETLAAASVIGSDGYDFSVSRTQPLAVASPAQDKPAIKSAPISLKANKIISTKAISNQKTKEPIMPRGPMPKSLALK